MLAPETYLWTFAVGLVLGYAVRVLVVWISK